MNLMEDDFVVQQEFTTARSASIVDEEEGTHSYIESAASSEEAAHLVIRYLNNYPRYGWVVCAIYILCCIIITYSITAGWTKPTYVNYWYTMLAAALIDLFVVEWVYLGLTWVYRWITGETKEAHAEVHPYDGEEVVRDF